MQKKKVGQPAHCAAEIESISDRRKAPRFRSTYRPCCVISPERIIIGLIRDYSSGGARIEADIDLAVGEDVSYFCDVNSLIKARIAWRQGNVYGMEHCHAAELVPNALPIRSVRVPCEAEARCWNGQEATSVQVENVSLGGMRIRADKELTPGTLLTVQFGTLTFEAATVRWSENGCAGIRFATRVTREDLAGLFLDDGIASCGISFAKIATKSKVSRQNI